MIRLPLNLSQIYEETFTLRFTSADECGYKMLFEAGSAALAHKMLALDSEAEYAQKPRDAFDAPTRPIADINADKDRALAALNTSRYTDGQGQHCLMLAVGEAVRLVAPIEQIKKLSELGTPVTAHNFTTAQVAAAATQILERFENSIQQVSEVANTQENGQGTGMFPPAPDAGPNR